MTSWWARWRLKSPASRLFTQSFIQAQIKENIKAPCHWSLWGEFVGDRWIPRITAINAENVSIWWRFNVKISSYQYRKSHCGDKTIVRSSYLHSEISYTCKITSVYWIRAQAVPWHWENRKIASVPVKEPRRITQLKTEEWGTLKKLTVPQ